METLFVVLIVVAFAIFLLYRSEVAKKAAKVLDLVRGKRPKDIPSDTDRV